MHCEGMSYFCAIETHSSCIVIIPSGYEPNFMMGPRMLFMFLRCSRPFGLSSFTLSLPLPRRTPVVSRTHSTRNSCTDHVIIGCHSRTNFDVSYSKCTSSFGTPNFSMPYRTHILTTPGFIPVQRMCGALSYESFISYALMTDSCINSWSSFIPVRSEEHT